MGKRSGRGIVGTAGWVILIALAVVAALYGAYRYAVATNGVALLDRVDRLAGGIQGTRLALHDGRYGPHGAQRIEVVAPDAGPPAPKPVVVFIHGGGWHSGRAQDYRFVGRALARSGYVTVLAGYRLTPDGVFPHMLEDGAAAVAWVRANAARFGGDPDQIVLMGHSAGAYNAVMLGLDPQWFDRAGVPAAAIRGVIGLSGPYDFLPLDTPSTVRAFGHVRPAEQTQPVRFARGDAPPLLLLTGDADSTVKPRNTRALAAALERKGAVVATAIVPGLSHEDPVIKLAAPFSRDRRVIDPVLAFLTAHTGASAVIKPSES
ncbi:acetyl esterase/lipase [Novosphingobium kunmingense]|uniref:Acetyl esterase/lipase n=1 Tax=Novosphingobium kunmingense TaxID=1211806 RepID=A0A2N0H4S9_9SPHN|nr:alpha/beta hydrolase [Novosphingobium kunmingense]PKB13937.1 acetyl esterase/lipase [Novosphingobium kunmingense]